MKLHWNHWIFIGVSLGKIQRNPSIVLVKPKKSGIPGSVLLFVYFCKLSLPWIGTLDKCYSSAFNALISLSSFKGVSLFYRIPWKNSPTCWVGFRFRDFVAILFIHRYCSRTCNIRRSNRHCVFSLADRMRRGYLMLDIRWLRGRTELLFGCNLSESNIYDILLGCLFHL